MSRRPTTHELEALIAAHAAELAALKAENEKLAQRVLHLEEELWRNLGDDGVRKAAYRGG
ncbi:cell division protein FtsB [Bradyrhizobium japonicum]